MLDLADVTLLLGVALVALLHNAFYLRPRIRRHAAEARKYRLFAIRDRLVGLVAQGKVREDSFAFLTHYKFANFLVNQMDLLDLGTFVRAMQKAKAKGIDPGPDNSRLISELEVNKELASVISDFYDVVVSIILENSLALRLFIRCKKLFPRKDDHLPPVSPVQKEAFEVYKTYSQASRQLSAFA